MKAIKKVIGILTVIPRTIFLVDSIGAALTTLLLFFVLRNFNDYFGIPKYILTYLAIIALTFCVYSTTCFFLLKDSLTPFIRVISIANITYSVLTIVFLYIYRNELTRLGIAYFSVEITIIISLVYLELKIASHVS